MISSYRNESRGEASRELVEKGRAEGREDDGGGG